MPNSTRKSGQPKAARLHYVPPKPKTFPLTPHPSGKWMKKIRGKLYYFGNWGRIVDGQMVRQPNDGRPEALADFNKKKDALYEGRVPREASGDELTIKALCNEFLTAKTLLVEAGELSPRSFYECKQATDLIIAWGKTRLVDDITPADFRQLRATMRKGRRKPWGPARLGKFVGLVRSVFKHAVDNKLIDRPIAFGTDFQKPKRAQFRKQKTLNGKKLFTADEIRQLLNGTTVKDKHGKEQAVPGAKKQLRAAVLLGLNAGLGNSDIAGLQYEHLDLKRGWIDYPRPKTWMPRRAPLWPETVEALNTVINGRRLKAKRPEDANCVFLNRGGRRMVQSTETSHSDYVTAAFGKLLRSMKINGRKGLNFYSLRHTFATIGLQTGDRDAVKTIMGHASNDMLSLYDETGPSDERLQAVVNHVHGWLFAEGGAK